VEIIFKFRLNGKFNQPKASNDLERVAGSRTELTIEHWFDFQLVEKINLLRWSVLLVFVVITSSVDNTRSKCSVERMHHNNKPTDSKISGWNFLKFSMRLFGN
jgi:hypothetical protein